MKAELEKARELAELLDNFRPTDRVTVEERDFLSLKERFQALEADSRERARLRGAAPVIAAARNAGRQARLSLLAATLLVLLAVAALIGIQRLWPATPQTLPVSTPTPSAEIVPASLALAPDLCGGSEIYEGTLESGDFTITLKLVCRERFARAAKNPEYYSEIDGLGMVTRWVYNGENRDAYVTAVDGFEPYWDGHSPEGSSKIYSYQTASWERGLTFPAGVIPDWKAVDAQLRYAVKLQYSDGGIEGAALTFTLRREADCFRPVDIAIEPLSAAERASLTGSEVTWTPFPLLPVAEVYPELGRVTSLLADWQDQISGNGGWIHWEMNFTGLSDGDAQQFEESTWDYWLLVDSQDFITACVAFQRAADGSLIPQFRMQNNFLYDFKDGEEGPAGLYRYPTVGNGSLLDDLMENARTGRAIEQTEEEINGQQTLVFTMREPYDPALSINGIEYTRKVTRYEVDAVNGRLLAVESYRTAADGRQALISSVSFSVEERTDPPPDEMMAYFEKPWPRYDAPASSSVQTHLPGAELWNGPKVVPDLCDGNANIDRPEVYDRLGIGNLNGEVLGGGQWTSGDFLFDAWLVCDFQFENSSRYLNSEISGLAVAWKWSYNGPPQDGAALVFAGMEPYISTVSYSEPVETGQGGYEYRVEAGMSGMDFQGIHAPALTLPDWNVDEAPLRYAIKVELPDGRLAGVALNFTLRREANGFRVVNIEPAALSALELSSPTASEVSESPLALLDPDAMYPELADVHALLNERERALLAGSGWFHLVDQVSSEGETDHLLNLPARYTLERWLQVDEQGTIHAQAMQFFTEDGQLLMEYALKPRQTSDPLFGLNASLGWSRYMAGDGLLDRLLQAARFGLPAERTLERIDGREAWVYTFRDGSANPILEGDFLSYGLVTREAIDAQSGAYLFMETRLFWEGSQAEESSRTIRTLEEFVDRPPEEVMALFEKAAPASESTEAASSASDKGPALAAGVCAEAAQHLGGGKLVSGDFTFNVHLVCDSHFGRSNTDPGDFYSVIDGLAFYWAWTYNGVDQGKTVSTVAFLEPYAMVSVNSEDDGPLYPGHTTTATLQGLAIPYDVFPDWQAGDIALRYVVKTEPWNGVIDGVALTFTLLREADGFRPVDIRVGPLSEAERASLTGMEVNEAPFPLLDLKEVHPDLAKIQALLDQRAAEMTAGGGWIRNVYVYESSLNGDGTEGESMEQWALVDSSGHVISSLWGIRNADGSLAVGDVYEEMDPTVLYATLYMDLMEELLKYSMGANTVEMSEETVDGRQVLVYGVDSMQYRVDAENGMLLSVTFVDAEGTNGTILRHTVEERVDELPAEVAEIVAGWNGD